MIFYAHDLLSKLNNLTLTGQTSEGNLEWIGTDAQWEKASRESEELQNAETF